MKGEKKPTSKTWCKFCSEKSRKIRKVLVSVVTKEAVSSSPDEHVVQSDYQMLFWKRETQKTVRKKK